MEKQEQTHYLDEMEKDGWFLGAVISS